MMLWSLLAWILAAIEPLHPREWLLQNLLVFTTTAVVAVTYHRFRFTNLSYGLLTVFLTLHLAGSHYTYMETPFGFWMQDWFAFERNHYDRVVHFCFGLLISYPVYEILRRLAGLAGAWCYWITVSSILAIRAAFEVVEAIAAFLINPDLGPAYLGAQGDPWDSQKDISMAFIGALTTMSILGIRRAFGGRDPFA